ncbi:efflux RND transporter permease subunit [Aureliella helgolandensis]|uniref:MMPL family protein n=1 Tax=Aureliella helgolandensis TaxID=2527968 RepID=A0A518GAH2_9BACT|nr:MMPL family transporter [Aureliella helgolandensis]QDV25591.1 MMPL family protein [Aureliella helgolandensis]
MKLKQTQAKLPQTFYQRWSLAIVVATLVFLPWVMYSAGKAVQSNVNRVEDWLPKSFEETQNLAWFRQHFASDQFVIVSWEGCRLGDLDAATPDDPRLEILAELLVPSDSQNMAGERRATGGEAELSAADQEARKRYFKSVVTGRRILDRLTNPPLNLSVQVANHRLQGSMIGPDGSQTCLIVTLHDAAVAELKQVLGTGQKRIFRENVPPGLLRRLIAQAGIAKVDVHLGGPPVDNHAIDEEGERTLIRLAGLSGLLGLGLAWWSLRSIPLTLIVFFCGVMSTATSLAIVGWTGQNFDAILMSMPSLVYVLAISGAVHLVNYYREAVQTQGLYAAAERAVQHAWKPALLCSVTTAVGLLSLSVSELVPIRKFGIYSAAGVMSLVLIVYFFLPAALQLSRIGRYWLLRPEHLALGTGAENKTASYSERIWEVVARFIVGHYRSVAALGILVTLGVGFGLRYTDSNIDLLKLFDSRAKILQDYRWLEANLGKLVPLEIVVRFPTNLQLENEQQAGDEYDWSALSFVQRLETVTRLQHLIEQKFGPGGQDLVGPSLSAASFAPSLPAANTGNFGFIQRKALNARLRRSRGELAEAGFLKIDAQDGSELWRISLRVAAFRDVDYGQFVRELQGITQPLLEAYHMRAEVLSELARLAPDNSPVGKQVMLWSHCGGEYSQQQTHETFQMLLISLLEEYRCEVQLLTEDPRTKPLNDLELLSKLDAVVLFGDFTNADVGLVRAGVPDTIDARFNVDFGGSPKRPDTGAKDLGDLSAIYTGVVPIVYQAQRALLNSLVESTWWSFLTITPIMMLVSRSFLAGAVAMLPNAVPVLWIFGGMGWLGIEIDIGSMMTASIALGVAVDDTIHFLARYREELTHSSNRQEAIVSTYRHCAVPTLQATLISGLGLSVFAFSTFTPTQRFGWLMLCILVAGGIAELVLLPALLASPLGRLFSVHRHPSKTSLLLDRLYRKWRCDAAMDALQGPSQPHCENASQRTL